MLRGGPGIPPSIIEVDLLDLDAPNGYTFKEDEYPSTAYLQYTSGSTRTPAGVVMSHQNVRVNFEQLMSGYFADTDGIPPPNSALVSWLPFYHDMGLVIGICAPILGGYPRCSPARCRSCSARPGGCT